MAITIVGTPQIGTASNGGDPTLTFDGTPQQDDVVVLIGGHGKSDSIGPITTGYTADTTVGGGIDGSASEARAGVWLKRLGASPDASVDCEGGGHPQAGVVYGCFVLRGVDTTTAIDVATVVVGPTTGNYDAGSITTVTDGAWVIAAACGAGSHGSPGTLTGYSNQILAGQTETVGFQVVAETKEIATAAAEDPAAWASGTDIDWFAFTIAIRPAGAAATPEVTASIPLTLTVTAESAADHDATTSIDLAVVVAPTAQIVHQSQASLPLTLDLTAVSGAVHQTTTAIPLTLAVAPVTDAPVTAGQVTASIPLTLTVAGTSQTQHDATAAISLTLAVTPQTAVEHSVTAAIPITLAVSATSEAEHRITSATVLALMVGPGVVFDPSNLRNIELSATLTARRWTVTTPAARWTAVLEEG